MLYEVITQLYDVNPGRWLLLTGPKKDLYDIAVITSYSIHYTKLYDRCSARRADGILVHPDDHHGGDAEVRPSAGA